MKIQQKRMQRKRKFYRRKLWIMFTKLYLIYWNFYLKFSVALHVILRHRDSGTLMILRDFGSSLAVCFSYFSWWSCCPLFAQLSPPSAHNNVSLLTNYSASYHNIATYSTNKQLFYFKAVFISSFMETCRKRNTLFFFMCWSCWCKVSFLMDARLILFQIAVRINMRVIKSVYIVITLLCNPHIILHNIHIKRIIFK